MWIRLPARLAAPVLVAALGLSAIFIGTTQSVSASASWAPAATATVHPGIQTQTQGAQCTANFVFSDGAGTVYLGQAAHCAGTGASTDTNGCTAASLPVGTPVDLVGSGFRGKVAYSSWITMQSRHETDANTCAYNDLTLVSLPAAAVASTNPSVPFWGGPVGLNITGTQQAETVLSYGNSSLRGGVTQLSPKQGKSLGTTGGGWSHSVYTVTPGIPGDSGSAFLDAKGNALGVLSTLAIAPIAGSNGVGDLAHELAYAQQYSGISGLKLEQGTEAFRGPLLPI
jgi:hypothetical protein